MYSLRITVSYNIAVTVTCSFFLITFSPYRSQAHTKSKNIDKALCSNCHGPIEVFLNQRDKDGKITLVPPKQPSGFAKFVKDNYKLFKASGDTHAGVMKILSGNFAKLTIQEKLKYAK